MSDEAIVTLEDGSVVRYREFPGVPGYMIGSDGSVWSRKRLFNKGYTDRWRRIKPARRCNGYLIVSARPIPSGKIHYFYLHRVLLEAFVGPCPEGMLACHNDGNAANNSLDNLRWDTQQGNMGDAVRQGTIARGRRLPQTKLREENIPLVRQLAARGFNPSRIAALFGVTQNAISAILRGETWKHVPEELS